ncbi:MAG: hypothetical protein LBL42_04195 [Tannerella sp.]|jgi:hypothetical protein|nr:hypothetical protein [Tannerella sp.]
MRSTFKVLFYLKRDKQKKDGSVPLFCRITVDGKEVRFGMKRDVQPGYWNVKAGKATGRSGEAVEINTLLDSTKAAIYKVYRARPRRSTPPYTKSLSTPRRPPNFAGRSTRKWEWK